MFSILISHFRMVKTSNIIINNDFGDQCKQTPINLMDNLDCHRTFKIVLSDFCFTSIIACK